jgi:predicted SAM-dependent methyltransferase
MLQKFFLKYYHNCKVFIIVLCNSFIKIDKISIGSGIRTWFGWRMVDILDHPLVTKVMLGPNSRLNFPEKKYSTILVSHFIEHIEESVFLNLLEEIKQLSHSNTKILIKYPDYEFFYKFFHSKKKNKEMHFDKITKDNFLPYITMWKNYGVANCLKNKVSMMFCDYSNVYYKTHYQQKKMIVKKSYHGPAQIDLTKLDKIFKNRNFKKITHKLKSEILKDKDFYAFNHLNCWNLKDLKKIIQKHFIIVTQNKKKIMENFSNSIPKKEISFIGDWSHFLYLKPKNYSESNN